MLHLSFIRNRYTIREVKKDERVLDPLRDELGGGILTRAIIDTIREPLIVLDEELRIIAASRSFYHTFQVLPSDTEGHYLYEIGNKQWDIPALRGLLKGVIPDHAAIDAFEVEHDFPNIGRRIMRLSAREIRYDNGRKKSLVTLYDITEIRELQKQRENLIIQKDLLLKEMRHRIANSLQLVASILMLRAETIDSSESKKHLAEAHDRIMSIATVQQQLDPVGLGEAIEMGPYLKGLCKSLANSMIGGRRAITLRVEAGKGTLVSDSAVSIGLMTTELVINSLKHGFIGRDKGEVLVSYNSSGTAWTLTVTDDGIGDAHSKTPEVGSGLGTNILTALANQMKANITTESSSLGTKVSIAFPG